MIKILIAEDQELMRQSLQIILGANSDFEVTDAVENGREVIRSVRREKPDIILMDIRMPEMDGVTCTQIIKESNPEIKIIILTTFDDDEYVYNALKFGASGYILKGVTSKELADDIRTVYNGEEMLNADIAKKVLKMFRKIAQSNFAISVNDEYTKDLSDAERNVIRCVGRGLSNKEIASELHLSDGTVRNYLSSVLSKLDLRDRTQLAIWAVQTGAVN